jgi:diaminopimelate epimerase
VPSVGPISLATFANGGGGVAAWTSPGSAAASDNSRASASISTFGTASTEYLKATNGDFSAVPDGATIDGIVVEIEADRTTSSGTSILTAAVVKGGTIGSPSATSFNISTTEAY